MELPPPYCPLPSAVNPARERVERQAVATRYDKRAYIFLGTVTLAALIIWLRT
ncbi:hypothetical protein [Nonomuraea jiangxiensis]|uniref:Transposase DDE domain-containing protein n=1 Tax=Nonomuraea jiangxiensis TaxID=633440 RepID=A0A1G8L5M2_9ACTN|nr:hypothetical protein [Nonomuraea jiangxiensis]SDI51014.1 hypothetical protein SAMN05421869_1062 [Nonomuraea jiangxiensis]